MLTESSRMELIAVGARLRAPYLIEQTGYTLGIAALDGSTISDLLPDGYLTEV